MTKLSILIPTLNEPESIRYLARLRSILDPQVAKYPGQCEIRIHDAGRSMPTGTKRNELIHNSEGEYFSQIDCDDVVPNYYVDELMIGINKGVDVISFVGFITTDGHSRKEFTIRLGERYEERNGRYYRYCNHLCCFKRSAVDRVKFRPIWQQEDYHYATEIRDKKLLKSEHHIDNKWMYHYQYVTKVVPKRHRVR
jgi:glycosyltransferase involved in cell wall biosynthesis